MNNMNWDGLRYFLAAAEAGSLSAAAKALNSNQPTIGRHIDTLETTLGVKLFQRSVKGISLTEEGQAVFEQAKKIQQSVVKIQRVVQGGEEHASGTVRLSLPEGLGQELLIPALDKFYKAYPDVKLIFNVSATTANLTQGEADVAVRLFRPEETDLVIKKLGEMKMGLYASKKYEKSHGLPDKLKDLRQHQVITYGDHLSILPENQWLLNHTEESLRILSSDSTVTRFKATTSGIGISIQPMVLSQANRNLIPLFKAANLPSHNVWMVYHKDLRHMARIRAVVDFISDYLTKALKQTP
ncbi:Transcriptional regulator, LysR family [hydrothermal vent metagenome]|uniref:Transcriptional regulator, LysR family n=1 Tax=hydrothermal vent metagenome TaxID=652676 RepID=A0A3B0W644_9ZZZZ